jgi:hypothetical protein
MESSLTDAPFLIIVPALELGYCTLVLVFAWRLFVPL